VGARRGRAHAHKRSSACCACAAAAAAALLPCPPHRQPPFPTQRDHQLAAARGSCRPFPPCPPCPPHSPLPPRSSDEEAEAEEEQQQHDGAEGEEEEEEPHRQRALPRAKRVRARTVAAVAVAAAAAEQAQAACVMAPAQGTQQRHQPTNAQAAAAAEPDLLAPLEPGSALPPAPRRKKRKGGGREEEGVEGMTLLGGWVQLTGSKPGAQHSTVLTTHAHAAWGLHMHACMHARPRHAVGFCGCPPAMEPAWRPVRSPPARAGVAAPTRSQWYTHMHHHHHQPAHSQAVQLMS